MANLDSTIRFIIKAEGQDAAVAALAKIEAAAQKAGTSVSKFLKTTAGDSLSNNLKLSASAANQLAAEQDKAANAAGRHSKAQDSLTASTRRSYFAQTALTTVLSAGINKAFIELVDVTGQAIQRVDLLSTFPASIAALGLSAQDASVSMGKLTDYIGKIGGNLQEATTSVTRFTEVTKNVKAATAEFVGVNNALIAGGAPAQVQKNALEQLTQAYSRGVPQLIEYKSLLVAMPAQLGLVAAAFKLPSAQALGEQLTTGKISIQDFVTELTKLSTGTGPIVAQAQARMTGIQFAFNQFKNALVTGITGIVQAIGRQNIVAFFQLLTGVVRQLAIYAVAAINALISLFNIVSKVFGGPQIAHFAGDSADVASNLAAGAEGAGNMADNLDDASKAAKKTAGQLAAFDKMNVLQDKTASDSGAAKPAVPGAGAGLDPSTAAALGKIFDGLDNTIGAITGKAKVLAAIIAGLAGIKFAQGLLNQFNGLIKTMDDTAKNLDRIKDKLSKGEGDNKKGPIGSAVQSVKDLTSSLINLGAAIIAAFSSSKLVTTIGKFGKIIAAPFLALSGIILDAFLAVAVAVGVALGLPLEIAIGIVVLAVAAIVAIIYLIYTNWQTIWNAVKTFVAAAVDVVKGIISGLVDGIKAAWNFLFDIFAAPIKFVLQFMEATLILIVALVAIFVQAVVGFFVFLVKGIFDILITVGSWIFDHVITPVLNFFIGLWNAVVNAVSVAWKFIFDNVLAPIGSWINVHVIQPILNFFKSLWDTVSGFVSGFFNSIVNFLGPIATWIKVHVIDPVFGFFNDLWNRIKDGLGGMLNGFKSLFGSLVDIVKIPINAVIDVFNKLFQSLNKIKVPDFVPGIGGKNVNFPMIPRLAKGGVVSRSTLINAGENGSEAIVPLENNLEWINKLADKINSANGGASGQPLYLTVQIGEDKVATKIIDLINEKTQMSGRNAIFV